MASFARHRHLAFLLVLGALVACRGRHDDGAQLFYGSCSVEVISKTKDSEIKIDGVIVGHDHAKVEIPCGEKQIVVEKEGHVPYFQYLPTTLSEPLKVTVELSRKVKLENPAFSKDLIAKALGPAVVAKAPGPSGGGAPAKTNSAESSAPWVDTVDYWR